MESWVERGATIGASEEENQDSVQKPSEELAATKIQAAFRGHKTRKTMSMKAVNKQPEPEPSKAELEAEFRADDKVTSQSPQWPLGIQLFYGIMKRFNLRASQLS
ncbi:hypothetical protein ACJJTC_011381 [Scirpophaga incertulas]